MKILSIAVPCYNSQGYMSNCIESLLVGGEDVEIIIVDDGSTKDDTWKVAQEYQEKYPGSGECYEKTVTNAFLEGRELFYMTSLVHIPYFRHMEDEFGILPVPMYSDSQDDYCSQMSAHTASVLMIPNTIKADEDLGLVIQALAELSEEQLTPEYYKKQLKFRVFTDEESAEMLDIIFENRHYDLGTVFGSSWNRADELYSILDTDIKNRFEEKEYVIKALIECTMDDIVEIVPANK